MHIVLGVLGTVVTILFLLSRLADAGIDLGGLNPFLWQRRRAWRKMIEGDPLFSISDPKEIAALFVVGIAKIDGDVSAEEKREVLSQFENTFKMSASKAAELFVSSAYLLKDPQDLISHVDRFLPTNQARFSVEQGESLMEMLDSVANAAGLPTAAQKQLIDVVVARVRQPVASGGTWT